jgi:predicted dehydrogenase
LKVVIIGYGSIGKRHCKNLSKIKNIEGLVVTKQKNVKLPSKKFKLFNSLDDCLKLNPDIGFVTNESNLHIKTAIKLAKAGCDLFIEKPLSHNSVGLKQLSKIVSEKKLITLMGCNFRFLPCLKKVKELISSNKVGRILFVQSEHGSYLPDWHPNENYRKSYAAQKKLGGGIVLTSIHEIDYLYWIFGDVKEVFSVTGKYSDLEMTADDLSTTILKFKKNFVGELHLDHFQSSMTRNCKIVGTKGIITCDLTKNTVNLFNKKTKKWLKILDMKNFDLNLTYMNEIKYLVECSQKRKKTINDLNEGNKVLNIALTVLKSSKNIKMVKL